MEGVHVILVTTPSAMDTHPTGGVKDASLCTSSSPPRWPKDELKTRTSSSSELLGIVKNKQPSMYRQALRLELNQELSTDNSAVSRRSDCCNARGTRPSRANQ